MAKTPETPAAMPEKLLRPRAANVWGAVALVFLPAFVVLFVGWEISDAVGASRDLVDNLGLVVMFAGVANVIRVVISNKQELCRRIAENLSQEHAITVLYPSLLIDTGRFSGGLTRRKVQAVDEYRRPLLVTLSLDDTGTKVIPTFHDVDGHPVRGR
ncbi:hypothetical protein [Arthrobacter gengyunqii]|uniref:PH domain-containing protein n=1 Tax=Arthrobacter gengyunqii TaxID=2886940 RepID=A0ABS8GDX8_9MICC|nr:hypothetical protein [Arthrobacter gengyunqii]MCC3264666.1 hypothetical protein [Arthrobacter gengyunqii]